MIGTTGSPWDTSSEQLHLLPVQTVVCGNEVVGLFSRVVAEEKR